MRDEFDTEKAITAIFLAKYCLSEGLNPHYFIKEYDKAFIMGKITEDIATCAEKIMELAHNTFLRKD